MSKNPYFGERVTFFSNLDHSNVLSVAINSKTGQTNYIEKIVFNKFEKPVEIKRLNTSGQVIQLLQSIYDSNGLVLTNRNWILKSKNPDKEPKFKPSYQEWTPNKKSYISNLNSSTALYKYFSGTNIIGESIFKKGELLLDREFGTPNGICTTYYSNGYQVKTEWSDNTNDFSFFEYTFDKKNNLASMIVRSVRNGETNEDHREQYIYNK